MKDSPRRMIYSREIRDMLESMDGCELKLCRIRQTTYCPPIAIRWRPDFAKIALREIWACACCCADCSKIVAEELTEWAIYHDEAWSCWQ